MNTPNPELAQRIRQGPYTTPAHLQLHGIIKCHRCGHLESDTQQRCVKCSANIQPSIK